MRRRRELEQFNVAMERERAKLRPPPSPIPPSLPSVRQLDDRPYVDNLDRVPPGFARSNNLYCPVMQKVRLKPHVMVEYAVEFDDMTIGFCCEDCVEAWKAMDDAERRERVKTVMAKK
jgi:hypothetical protein